MYLYRAIVLFSKGCHATRSGCRIARQVFDALSVLAVRVESVESPLWYTSVLSQLSARP